MCDLQAKRYLKINAEYPVTFYDKMIYIMMHGSVGNML